VSDAALLALIIDDEGALRSLAAWAALHPGLSRVLDDDVLGQIAEIAAIHRSQAPATMKRLIAAQVLTDDGITELADKLLQTHVQQRMGLGGKKK
jgi:hypothetical protein